LGLKKIAALLISLGPELSAQVLRLLPEEDIESITAEIANTDLVEATFRDKVVGEFLELHQARNFMMEGGVKYARDMLDRALGPARSVEIIRKLADATAATPFSFAKKVDAKQLTSIIQEEHPQTIALVLSYLEPDQGATVLSTLSAEVRAEVARRIATMERVSPEVLAELETVLSSKFASFTSQDFTAAGGIKTVVNILNRVDRATEKMIFEQLEHDDPALADEIRKRLIVFEDIITLDGQAIQRILRDVDTKDLALALKGANSAVSAVIMKNMSKRAGEMLREDMEFLGPIRLREVEQAQQRIAGIIRQLDETGEIVMVRGSEDAAII
jgi:flagellar motor switch protein FliG